MKIIYIAIFIFIKAKIDYKNEILSDQLAKNKSEFLKFMKEFNKKYNDITSAL